MHYLLLGETDLIQALEEDANINQKNNYGETSLMIAARYGSQELITSLLDNGADIDQKDRYGQTSLMIAGIYGRLENVNTLLGRGADVNHQNIYGYTPLMISVRSGLKEIVNAILLMGADVNQRDCQGETALVIGAIHSRQEIVNTLLDWGADSNIQNNKHSTVFDTLISTCNEVELRQFTLTGDSNQELSEKVVLLNRLAEVVDFSDNNDRGELVQEAIRAGYIRGSIVESAYQRAKEISEAQRFILK